MFDSPFTWSLASLTGLGIFHGLNPGMGWLFAVAIGMQERSLRSVIKALGPIALGHALAIAVVVVTVSFLGTFLPISWLLTLSGFSLLGFGVRKIATRFRHPSWVGMRVSNPELALWSFVMASAHGAGLMLVPVLLRMRNQSVPGAVAEGSHTHHIHPAAPTGEPLNIALATIGIHTASMIVTSAFLAVIVYQVVGVGILRKAWINLDGVWAGAILITGGVTLVMGVLQLLPL